MRIRRKSSLRKVVICLLLLVFIFLLLFLKFDKDIRPVLFSVSSTEVKISATESINRIVKEELSGNIKYSDFVTVKADKDGVISAIEMNTVEMNKFGSNVALRVQDELKFIEGKGVDIPLGIITGSSLLSDLGPKINIKVMPLGNVITDFKSELESAGINQSRYRVFITVNAELQIIVPFGDNKMNVASTIPIAETLIVGKVPGAYFSTQSGGINVPSVVPMPSEDTN